MYTSDRCLPITQWTINGIRYESPDLPTLLNIIANNFTTESQFSTSEHTFVLNRNEIVELQIHGSADGHKQSVQIIQQVERVLTNPSNSPFHLHGHVFSVVQAMTGAPNFVNPPQRGKPPPVIK
jgi:iron transport multicopper oxidase